MLLTVYVDSSLRSSSSKSAGRSRWRFPRRGRGPAPTPVPFLPHRRNPTALPLTVCLAVGKLNDPWVPLSHLRRSSHRPPDPPPPPLASSRWPGAAQLVLPSQCNATKSPNCLTAGEKIFGRKETVRHNRVSNRCFGKLPCQSSRAQILPDSARLSPAKAPFATTAVSPQAARRSCLLSPDWSGGATNGQKLGMVSPEPVGRGTCHGF